MPAACSSKRPGRRRGHRVRCTRSINACGHGFGVAPKEVHDVGSCTCRERDALGGGATGGHQEVVELAGAPTRAFIRDPRCSSDRRPLTARACGMCSDGEVPLGQRGEVSWPPVCLAPRVGPGWVIVAGVSRGRMRRWPSAWQGPGSGTPGDMSRGRGHHDRHRDRRGQWHTRHGGTPSPTPCSTRRLVVVRDVLGQYVP
ncbi:MAG: hypothetical protein QOF92_4956 [Pseudonocardiales bacterium]|jgi:hypothetical protein|nr:hypothetical protein [Pseudonocardiales bacterium]